MEKKRERSVPFTGSAYFKRNIGTIIGLILLIIIVSISTPKFMTSSNLLNLLKSNSVNAIICCGMLLAILMGEIDISVGSTVGLTGVIGAYMITNLNAPVWLTVISCLAVGALVGTVNGFAVAYLQVPAFVATLATQCIGRGLTEIISGGVTIRVRNAAYTGLGNLSIGGVSIIIVYAAVILIATWVLLNKTRFGYYIYALGGNKTAARYSGVNVKKYNMLPYILIGLLCGVGGIVWSARLGSAAATLGNGFEICHRGSRNRRNQHVGRRWNRGRHIYRYPDYRRNHERTEPDGYQLLLAGRIQGNHHHGGSRNRRIQEEPFQAAVSVS